MEAKKSSQFIKVFAYCSMLKHVRPTYPKVMAEEQKGEGVFFSCSP